MWRKWARKSCFPLNGYGPRLIPLNAVVTSIKQRWKSTRANGTQYTQTQCKKKGGIGRKRPCSQVSPDSTDALKVQGGQIWWENSCKVHLPHFCPSHLAKHSLIGQAKKGWATLTPQLAMPLGPPMPSRLIASSHPYRSTKRAQR